MPVDAVGRRATRIAKVGIDLAWWLGLLLSALLAILFVLSPVLLTNGSGLNEFAVDVSISDSAPRTVPLTAPHATLASEIFLADRNPTRRLEFRTTHWRWFLMINWVVLPGMATVLLGIHWFRSFLRDVLEGKVFTGANAARLSNLGWLFIAMGIAGPLVERWRSWIVLARLELAGPALSAAKVNWDTGSMMFGVLLLVLAAVWRYGTELQQDRDLTV